MLVWISAAGAISMLALIAFTPRETLSPFRLGTYAAIAEGVGLLALALVLRAPQYD
jgi:hypothetical protein